MAQVMDSNSSSGRSELSSSNRIYIPPTSKSSTSSSLVPSSVSSSSAASFARRSLRRKQHSDPLISSSNAASTVFPRDYLEQEAKAKRIFRKLAKEYQQIKEIPTQEVMDKLNIYHEILRDKIISWSTEVSDSLRVEIYEEKVSIFRISCQTT